MTLTVGDRVALGDLVARYAAYADGRELDELAGLFTDDAVLLLPEPPRALEPVRSCRGRAEIKDALSALSAFPLTFHELAGAVHDPGGASGLATGRVAGVAHHLSERSPGTVTDLVWHVRYSDVYRRGRAGWRFARREVAVEWIETRPVRRWRPAAAGQRAPGPEVPP